MIPVPWRSLFSKSVFERAQFARFVSRAARCKRDSGGRTAHDRLHVGHAQLHEDIFAHAGVAVAVSAKTVGLPSAAITRPRLRYAGRKIVAH